MEDTFGATPLGYVAKHLQEIIKLPIDLDWDMTSKCLENADPYAKHRTNICVPRALKGSRPASTKSWSDASRRCSPMRSRACVGVGGGGESGEPAVVATTSFAWQARGRRMLFGLAGGVHTRLLAAVELQGV